MGDQIHTQTIMKVFLLALFSALLVSAEGRRRIGKRNGKHAGGKERSQQATRRVFHMAETEENCGNYTELYSEEKPSDLCEEANTTFCICATRENISEENNAVTEQPTHTWQFRCGACELKWSVEKDEEEEDSKEGEKKVKKENNKKKVNSNMKEAKPRSEN